MPLTFLKLGRKKPQREFSVSLHSQNSLIHGHFELRPLLRETLTKCPAYLESLT